MSADASHARLAGFLYLGTIGFGVYAEVVARGALIVRGDPAATAQAIFASGSTFRIGMIADLAMLGCYIGVTILLHGIFRKRAPLASATAASFSLIGIAMLACDTLLSAMILRLPDLGQLSSSLADWVYLLADGKVIAQGSPQALRENPDPRVQQFLCGDADGPVPFRFPAQPIEQELFSAK